MKNSRYKQALIENLAIQNMRHAASKDRVFHFWFEYQDEISQALQKVERLEAEKEELENICQRVRDFNIDGRPDIREVIYDIQRYFKQKHK